MNSKAVHYLFCVIIILLVSISGGCEQLRFDTRGGLPNIKQPLTTHIYYDDGELLAKQFLENRIEVSLEDLPQEIIQATVATEDRRFFNHFGLDLSGIARAAYHNIQNQRVTQGGSTISQQLVKNLFLTHDRTWQRKLNELILTLQLEQTFSKKEILEKYLNTIYYGHSAYGIEAASLTYFGKAAAELTLAEAAMLAGLPRGPLYYSPIIDMDAARQRQAYVLEQMLTEGYISEEEKEAALLSPIILNKAKNIDEAAYFIEYLINIELAQIWEEEPDLLYHGGLNIYTTLDHHMQSTAERLLEEEIPILRTDETGVTQPQGALVAMDPANGYVRAMVGGKDYGETMFNRAFSLRSPGSTFKPFVYAAALEQGYTANSRFLCEPLSLTEEGMEKPYEPADYGGIFHHDHLTIREAIVESCNVTSVKLNHEMGKNISREMAVRLGIKSNIGDYFSLPLGTSEVTLMEMTTAFATFANSGYRVEPIIVKKIVDANGEVILDNSIKREQVLDEEIAYLLTDMMKGVFGEEGTGHRATTILDRPAAGKTGTSHDTRDAYTVGYTPDLVAGIYIGDDQGHSLGATGGQLAAPIWAQFITEALKDSSPQDFRRPENIIEATICPETGKIQGSQCWATGYTEIFIKGTQPGESCSYPECTSSPSPYPWWQWWRHF